MFILVESALGVGFIWN